MGRVLLGLLNLERLQLFLNILLRSSEREKFLHVLGLEFVKNRALFIGFFTFVVLRLLRGLLRVRPEALLKVELLLQD